MTRWTLPLVALLGAVLGAVVMTGVDRFVPGAGPGRAQMNAAIHDYLLANPEIIPEAMQRLQDRETGKQVAASRGTIVTPVGSAWAGNPKGDVTLAEYFDYNCGYCRASLPLIDKLVASDPKLRVVYRELPVLSQISHTAALASLAAAHQGHFATFHQALYALGPVSDATIAAAATKAGVTVPATPSPADEAEITRNMKTAGQLGMTGTPSWVIGNRVLAGALPIETLQEAIAAARGS
jgi:protein-disulfide isomerase